MRLTENALPEAAAAMGLTVHIPVGNDALEGVLTIPEHATGLVIFAHGSGSSRRSPRNRYVASLLNKYGLATLLADLLTAREEVVDEQTRHFRFDIPLLSARLEQMIKWAEGNQTTKNLPIGIFGASTGAAAALVAAAELGDIVRVVVSRGGRPDLAGDSLPLVTAPVLLIVGEEDPEVLRLNEQSLEKLNDHSAISIVPQATHLFEEPGTLKEAAQRAALWFDKNLD